MPAQCSPPVLLHWRRAPRRGVPKTLQLVWRASFTMVDFLLTTCSLNHPQHTLLLHKWFSLAYLHLRIALRLLSPGAFALAAPLLCPASCPPPWHCSSLARSALGAALRFAPIHIDTACLGAAPLWRCPSLAAAVIPLSFVFGARCFVAAAPLLFALTHSHMSCALRL